MAAHFEEMYKIGRVGEDIAHHVIKDVFGVKGIDLTQLDKAFYMGDKCYVVEVKHQEVFRPPPFYGHGLPLHQINFRLKMYEINNVRPILLVVEKDTNEKFKDRIYVQYLDILNENPQNYFDTKGVNRRRVYNIELFEDITEKVDKKKVRGA